MIGTALITPFKKSKEIDFESFKKLINYQVDAGITHLIIAGTTGEGATLTDEELIELLKFGKKYSKNAKIIAGCGSNSTKIVTDKIEKLNKLNLDGYLVVTPYYNKPTQIGLFEHYKEISKSTNKDIILYNVPGRTASQLLPETIEQIINSCKNVTAIKEASGSVNFAMNMYEKLKKYKKFKLISGDDALTLPLISIGFSGVISVVSNEFPKSMLEIVKEALNGNYEKAKKIHYKLLNLMEANFIESNPIPVKYVMKKLGFCDGSMRLPMTELSKKDVMDKVLKEYL